ncbi:MAG: right-handed parallel beta-helix repeat-containing protein [Candidatus Eisenbacteria sp.]|nr:right-handed parallel beta-helix repeat-containing protein [Candidatus Eisenbacteria bacterium]
MRRLLQLGPAIALLALGGAHSAPAHTIHVPAEYSTIQGGIDAASPGDTVVVACGWYYDCTHLCPDSLLSCVIMKSGICLRSETGQADCVTIDAQHLGRVIYCEGAISTTRIEGFTLRAGYAIWFTECGAGAYCRDSSPVFTNVVFRNSHADEDGGGMYCIDSGPVLTGCTFMENSCYDCGAGIGCVRSAPVLVDCAFSDNWATLGGGIAFFDSPTSLLSGCHFSGNSADCGGGMICRNSSPLLTNCCFSANVSDYHGAGTYCFDSSFPSFDYCTFSGNLAAYDGGGISSHHDPFVLSQCTFYGNSASRQGGGIRLARCPSATLENTIIAGSTEGEAVSCDLHSAASLSCCDLYGNDGGDWVGSVADQFGQAGNICANPLFCGPGSEDFSISAYSPCEPGHSGCGLIGAFGVGCDITSVGEADEIIFRDLHLGPATPNPFNPVTEIAYSVPACIGPSRLVMNVYEATGRRVTTLVDADRGPGTYRVIWDGRNDDGTPVASGVYFCRITWNGESDTKRMVLLK